MIATLEALTVDYFGCVSETPVAEKVTELSKTREASKRRSCLSNKNFFGEMDVTHTNYLCVSGSCEKLFVFHRQDKISGSRIFLLNFEAGKFGTCRFLLISVNLANSLECLRTSQK